MELVRKLSFKLFRNSHAEGWDDNVLGTIYGNCVGDAIGLLTEFMEKKIAKHHYGKFRKLEYSQKVEDLHRDRWEVGDWTDDSDQMILIIISIVANNGKVDPSDFGKRLKEWKAHGYPELGDKVGFGIGTTTHKVLSNPKYNDDPHAAAKLVWEANYKRVAPNGGVMRTSVLGIFQYDDIEKVIQNTLNIVKTTHYDPRCQASCVAVTTAIAMMLQRRPAHMMNTGEYDIQAIMEDSFKYAQRCLPSEGLKKDDVDFVDHVELLRSHMFATSLEDLELGEVNKIGYTYKCMGSGFWALRQNDFRKAITTLLMEGGDADTNCAVAGALLGCKLGFKNLPKSWVKGLKYKDWLQEKIDPFIRLVNDDVSSRAVGKSTNEGDYIDKHMCEEDKTDEAVGGPESMEPKAEIKEQGAKGYVKEEITQHESKTKDNI